MGIKTVLCCDGCNREIAAAAGDGDLATVNLPWFHFTYVDPQSLSAHAYRTATIEPLLVCGECAGTSALDAFRKAAAAAEAQRRGMPLLGSPVGGLTQAARGVLGNPGAYLGYPGLPASGTGVPATNVGAISTPAPGNVLVYKTATSDSSGNP